MEYPQLNSKEGATDRTPIVGEYLVGISVDFGQAFKKGSTDNNNSGHQLVNISPALLQVRNLQVGAFYFPGENLHLIDFQSQKLVQHTTNSGKSTNYQLPFTKLLSTDLVINVIIDKSCLVIQVLKCFLPEIERTCQVIVIENI